MKTIIYDKKGIAVSDYEVENVLDEFINSDRTELKVSSIFVIITFRRYVLERFINHEDYEVFVSNDYNLIKLEFDDKGFVINMPNTLIDKAISYLFGKLTNSTANDDIPMDVGITDIDTGII